MYRVNQPGAQSAQSSDVNPQVSNWNLPNILTCLRIVFIPVFAWLVIGGHQWWSFGVFAALMLTDKLDGDIARARGLITDFGKIADPIADKALTLSAFVLLSVAGRLWWWVTVLIIVRELGITLMRFVMLRRAVMAASRGGKLKTALQVTGIFGLLVPWAAFVPPVLATALDLAAYALVGSALVVTLVTGADYVLEALRLSRADPGGRP